MKNVTKNEKTEIIGVVGNKEKLRVVCVERKYRVSDSKIGFIITAKKEFDENTTQELLHEDMELKTFLENYQISDIVPISPYETPIPLSKGKLPESNRSMENIKVNMSRNNVKGEAMKRRALFDSLDLQENFLIKDYRLALEKKGIVTTNTAMPYDDLDWLEKQGKVARVGKSQRGAVTFMIKRKEAETIMQ